MKTIKVLGMAGVLALWGMAASAQTETSYTFNSGQIIPDNNPLGLTLSTNLSISGGSISSLTVALDITGGFNGDLYAYLVGPGGGYAVLLNRTGVGSGSLFGYANTGFLVTFDDTAASSIHFYQTALGYSGVNGSGQLTGNWQPDGETIDPRSGPSLFGAPQNAMLGSFVGSDPNGTWTLFLADLSSGGQSTLLNWKLDVMTVPEPSALALTGLGLAGMYLLLRRRPRGELQMARKRRTHL